MERTDFWLGWSEWGRNDHGAKWPDTVLTSDNSTGACFLRGKLSCVYPTGLGWYSLGSNIAHSIWRLCLRLRSKLFVICVWCLFFHSGILQNIKHKQLDLFHFNYFKCCGWITKWPRSCVYAIVTIEGYRLKSWSRIKCTLKNKLSSFKKLILNEHKNILVQCNIHVGVFILGASCLKIGG